jgi:hypothetical protein
VPPSRPGTGPATPLPARAPLRPRGSVSGRGRRDHRSPTRRREPAGGRTTRAGAARGRGSGRGDGPEGAHRTACEPGGPGTGRAGSGQGDPARMIGALSSGSAGPDRMTAGPGASCDTAPSGVGHRPEEPARESLPRGCPLAMPRHGRDGGAGPPTTRVIRPALFGPSDGSATRTPGQQRTKSTE